ncbi:MAG: hypothetical protein PVI28_07375 [Gammaproteobacteria bacterium]|jgi:hypothetical protein
MPLLVAGSIAAGLLVAPVVQAEEEVALEQATSEQAASAETQAEGSESSYPAPGAVPPPPGPYSAGQGGVPPQFRPDQELETAPADYPASLPPMFRGDSSPGPVTREEFLSGQEERREQMDQYRAQHQAEMEQYRQQREQEMEEYQKQREQEREQRRGEAEARRDVWLEQREEGPCSKELAQLREQMQKEWEQRRAEYDKRWEEIEAEREQRLGSRPYPGAPLTRPKPPEPPAPPTRPFRGTTERGLPSYGYPARAPGYRYGYPPRPGYGGPGWRYPGYQTPATGGKTPARQVE